MITLSLLHPINKTPVQNWTFETESVIRIGRSTDNDVILYSAVVSRHHVELRQTEQGWLVMSLGTNGTYLEGKRIEQVPVEDGLIIRLARSGPNIQINLAQQDRSAAAMQALRARQPSINTAADEPVSSLQGHRPADKNQPSFASK